MSCEIDARKYTEQIESLITKIDFVAIEEVLVVPSVHDWCNEKNVTETGIFRQGKCLRNSTSGAYLILVGQQISPCSWSTGWPNDYLDTDWKVVRHLVLHEIAHVIDEDFDEEDCDNWAVTFAKDLDKEE